ncbi:hypothetical protein ACHAWF_017038 [Thalassiosira exigua]
MPFSSPTMTMQPAVAPRGVPSRWGTLHPTLQRFQARADNDGNGGHGEEEGADVPRRPHADPSDVRTWFDPTSDDVAFHTPGRAPPGGGGGRDGVDGGAYPTLTYRRLRGQMDACPLWPAAAELLDASRGGVGFHVPFFSVGILLPSDLMTELAVAHLCVMSGGAGGKPCCSAPLDPRSSRTSLLSAMDQMKCRGLVATRDMISKYDLDFLLGPASLSLSDFERRVSKRIVDVRVVESGQDAQGRRDGSLKWTVLRQDANPTFEDAEPSAQIAQDPAAKASASLNASPTVDSPPLLLLRTSGTTSEGKVVPLTGPQLLFNARRQIEAMGLTKSDIAANAMPLFHIGGLSCGFFSVLVSGGSVIYSGRFDPDRFLDHLCGGGLVSPASAGKAKATWYNAVPTMHRALLLRMGALGKDDAERMRTSNALRFVRSGAAPLDGDLVAGLTKALGGEERDIIMINSYALSECMPVCVQPFEKIGTGPVGGTTDAPSVGVPVGPSLRIADLSNPNVTLPYGAEGEICICGPGVIAAYLDGSPSETHTSDGWLRTGDVGKICPRTGHVSITGRIKEMIKRGGEQVWPVQVDSAILGVDGVAECVTFGVANKLWGEEVASAVVLKSDVMEDDARSAILLACKKNLDSYAVPAQIIFVQSSSLPKGPSGKYLRAKTAETLGISSVDTTSLVMMESQASDEASDLDKKAIDTAMLIGTEGIDGSGIVQPDAALHGARLVASIFILLNSTGYYSGSIAMEKMRGFNVSIPIFFILAAFNLVLSVRGPIKWSSFVGTRIGQLHSLFVISQLIALPSYLIFNCANDTTNACSPYFYRRQISIWFFSTLTGMFGIYNSANGLTWFLSLLYQCTVIFPWVDKWARTRTRRCQSVMLAVIVMLAMAVHVAIFFSNTPGRRVNQIRWTILANFPLFFSAMLAAYFFLRSKGQAGDEKSQKKVARRWAIITDLTSLVFIGLYALVALSENSTCIWLPMTTAAVMRPEQAPYDVSLYQRQPPLADMKTAVGFGQIRPGQRLVKVCHITWDEYAKYIHDTPATPVSGRFGTKIGLFIWGLRMGSPIALLWIYGLAHGHGLTARIMRLPFLTGLAPYSYHLYLLQIPMVRYYWLLTRPDSLASRRFWYPRALYPTPIAWWELILIVFLTMSVGWVIEQWLIPLLQPYTVKVGLWVCEGLSSFFRRVNKSVSYDEATNATEDESASLLDKRSELDEISNSTEELIKEKIRGLTGFEVSRDSGLVELGLDSLGVTALLSMLRSTTPLADKLTVQDLAEIETIGQLIDYLDRNEQDVAVATSHSISSPTRRATMQSVESGSGEDDVEAGLLSVIAERSPNNTITIFSKRSEGPSSVVVFCHGLGETGEKYVDMMKILANQMPHIKFILPTATSRYVAMRGSSMPAWYNLAGLDERSNESCEGVDASIKTISAILDEEEKKGVPYERMILGGFSQGGALAVLAGMKLSNSIGPLAGILLLSGYLPAPSKLDRMQNDMPILHLHGDSDDVVPRASAVASKQRAVDLGAKQYDLKIYAGLGHSVSSDEVNDMTEFLRTVLPPIEGSSVRSAERFSIFKKLRLPGSSKLESILITLALLLASASAILAVRYTAGSSEVNSNPMIAYTKSESNGMVKSQKDDAYDPERIRYNKFTLLDGYSMDDPNCSAELPLGPTDYPASDNVTSTGAHCMLKSHTDSVSVVALDDWEVSELDVVELISEVGGMPPHPSSSEDGEYWDQLAGVMNLQIKRIRRGGALARIALKTFPLPFRWVDLSINGVAAQVHEEYPGSHQATMIEDMLSGLYGRLETDSAVIPQRSRVHFLLGMFALAELNNWAIGRVGPYNFAAKWLVGRARPEEVVAEIQAGNLSYVPTAILDFAKKLPRTSRAEDFTAYPEGSPRHPSWPAMHGAASGLSSWLPIVMDLTPLQQCQAKLIDFAVSYARVVAGVHYEDDVIAGLDMGQEIVARLLPEHLSKTYGADAEVVKAKVERMRFSWRDFEMTNPCPGVDWKVWQCDYRVTRCRFDGPVDSTMGSAMMGKMTMDEMGDTTKMTMDEGMMNGAETVDEMGDEPMM